MANISPPDLKKKVEGGTSNSSFKWYRAPEEKPITTQTPSQVGGGSYSEGSKPAGRGGITPGGVAGRIPKESVTTRRTKPVGDKPEFGALPEFVSAPYSRERVDTITQRLAAPGVRGARQGLREAIASSKDANPNVRKMTLRAALAGYGQGLESIMSGASQAATQQYSQLEHGPQQEAARANYQATINKQFTEFEASWNAYVGGFETTQTTGDKFGEFEPIKGLPRSR